MGMETLLIYIALLSPRVGVEEEELQSWTGDCEVAMLYR